MKKLRAWLKENNASSWAMRAMGAADVIIGTWGMFNGLMTGLIAVSIGVGLLGMDWSIKRLKVVALQAHAQRMELEKAGMDFAQTLQENMGPICDQIRISIEAKRKEL